MKKFIKTEINKKNSSTWVACNDDSKSIKYRKDFLHTFGGEFVKIRSGYLWRLKQKPVPVYVPFRLLKFLDPNKKVLEIDHMTEFCILNKLNRAAMYEVMSGKRKSHKGYTAIPKPPDLAP